MKHTLALVLGLSMLAGPVMAESALGTWQTQPDDNGNFGHVDVTACGESICGTIVRAYGSDGKQVQSKNVGKRIVWDMKPKGGGKYSGGKIYAPDRDKTYNSKMQLNGDRMKVSGCVLGFCRGQTWVRVK